MIINKELRRLVGCALKLQRNYCIVFRGVPATLTKLTWLTKCASRWRKREKGVIRVFH